LFLNLLSAPEGIAAFKEEFPELRIVTAFVDDSLDHRKYIGPTKGGMVLTIDSLSQGVGTLGIDSLERTEKRGWYGWKK
jgi:hypothetical protein